MSSADLMARICSACSGDGLQLSYVDDCYLLVGPGQIVAETVTALAPFVRPGPATAVPDVALCVLSEPPPAELCAKAEVEGERIVIDASLYPSATKGWRLDLDSYRVVLIEKTGSLCVFAPGERLVGLLNSDLDRLAEDAQRLLKSLIMLHCERRGMLVLHASGISLDGRCFLFAGHSRSGKTTTLLGALDRFEVDMLSCDTSVIWTSGSGLRVRGWPSSFSVSVGTMFDFETLLDHLEPEVRSLAYDEVWSIHPKRVLETSALAASAGWQIQPEGKLDGIVALAFAPDGQVGLEPLGGPSLGDFVGSVTLGSRDVLYPDWHGFWSLVIPIAKASVDLCAAVEAEDMKAYSMRWAPAPETLLRRIPTLDRVHRHTLACRAQGWQGS
jgi:hypothetical protein